MKLNIVNISIFFSLSLLHFSCSQEYDLRGGKQGKEHLQIEKSASATADSKTYLACEVSDEHRGFGGRLLESQSKGNEVETDFDRIRPFSSLRSSYQRMGLDNSCLDAAEASYGITPQRWFVMDEASAITVSAIHTANFCAAEEWIKKNKIGTLNESVAKIFVVSF